MTNQVDGQVAKIGDKGNLVTDIPNAKLSSAPRDSSLSVQFDGHETMCLYEADHSEPESTMVAYLGPSDHLEIEIVGMDLAGMLGIAIGAKVSVIW